MCCIRSENFVKGVKEKSLFMDLFANAPQNVVAYEYAKYPELADVLFKNKNLTFVVNSSKINFILPQCGIMMIKRPENFFDIYIPISPQISLVLTDYVVVNNGILVVGESNEVRADIINMCAVKTEFLFNQKALYAKEYKDLERYREYMLSLNSG